MSIVNQQTLAESRAEGRHPILEKWSYVPWASRFLRFLDNKREEGELMRRSIDKGPYKRREIVDPNDNSLKILEPIKDLSLKYQKQYYADIKHMEPDQKTDASPSNSHSPQPYYVNYPSFVIDYDDDYQGEIQGVAQEDKLSTAMMNVGYAGNGKRNARRKNRNQATNARNGLVQKIDEYDQNVQRVLRTESTLRKTNIQCYNCNGKGRYARECPKPRVRDAKYFREQMLLAAKDKAGLEELNASMIMMACIQPTDDKSDVELTYDAELISEKLEIVINTSADDQIDSNIIFDDPYVDNNSGQAEYDSNAHDQPYADIESLIYNVQVEAESQRKMNIELNKQKTLLQRELETCKERVKEFKKKPVQFINYKFAYENLQKQISVEQENIEKLKMKKKRFEVNLPDFEETLEEAEKSQLKMKDKMIPLDYSKLNKLYESFVPQKEISADDIK
ncbi:retrovirus-related pol polyprotein from transposon TNT 1-94 [Tanacetum coccineum]